MINYWAKPFQTRPHLNEQSEQGVNLAGFQTSESDTCLDLKVERVMGGCTTSPRQSTAIKIQTVILQNNFLNSVLTRVNKCSPWVLLITGRIRLGIKLRGFCLFNVCKISNIQASISFFHSLRREMTFCQTFFSTFKNIFLFLWFPISSSPAYSVLSFLPTFPPIWVES